MVAELRRTALGEAREDLASRELYAVDASLYRRLPAATLRARDEGDLDAAVEACRAHGVPLTVRAPGSMAIPSSAPQSTTSPRPTA
jgi:FAD/FMN-containing dehydrogenase